MVHLLALLHVTRSRRVPVVRCVSQDKGWRGVCLADCSVSAVPEAPSPVPSTSQAEATSSSSSGRVGGGTDRHHKATPPRDARPQFAFTLEQPHRSLQFRGSSAGDLESWLRYVQFAIDAASDISSLSLSECMIGDCAAAAAGCEPPVVRWLHAAALPGLLGSLEAAAYLHAFCGCELKCEALVELAVDCLLALPDNLAPRRLRLPSSALDDEAATLPAARDAGDSASAGSAGVSKQLVALRHRLLLEALPLLPDASVLRASVVAHLERAGGARSGSGGDEDAAVLLSQVCAAVCVALSKYVVGRFKASRHYTHLTQLLVRANVCAWVCPRRAQRHAC